MSVRVMYCERVLFSYGKLQQIAIRIFSLVYLHLEKLQSNPKTNPYPNDSQDIDGLENELNYKSARKMAANTNVRAPCITLTLVV